jgi:hypothetical protein
MVLQFYDFSLNFYEFYNIQPLESISEKFFSQAGP